MIEPIIIATLLVAACLACWIGGLHWSIELSDRACEGDHRAVVTLGRMVGQEAKPHRWRYLVSAAAGCALVAGMLVLHLAHQLP